MKTKLKEGRYYLHSFYHTVYWVQYINLNGVPCIISFRYQACRKDNPQECAWYDDGLFGCCGEYNYLKEVDERALYLIPKKMEKGITCFSDNALTPYDFKNTIKNKL